MAELLIMRRDNLNPNLEHRYYKGDIVEVRENGFAWGTEMSFFYLLKIPEVNPETIRKYANSETLGGFMIRRRTWRILIDSVPQWVRTQLRDNGEVTVSKSQIRNFINSKLTNHPDPDL